MKLFLPQRKVEEIVQMSQNAMEDSLTLRDLTKLQRKLTSTTQPILPAKLQIHFLQQIQIQALIENIIYKYYSGPVCERGAVMVDDQHAN